MSPVSIFPTGVTIYCPDKAYNCYVLFDGRDTRSYLIDMNGNEVKVWNYSGFPVEMLNPSPTNGERGHVLVQKEPDIFANETLLELTWDGDVAWPWGDKAPGGKARQNHDLARLPNGNTLICEGMHGHVFQVTAAGEIVWEYANPHFGEWADHDSDSGGRLANWIFRAQPTAYDWVPEGTPRSEVPVIPPDLADFHV